jgi:outer membrane receptor protein involved in Fe transport
MGVTGSLYGNVLENPAGQYNTLEGGNPDLEPEIADTIHFGVVVTPEGAPGFTAALDYYDVDVDGTIDPLEADDIMNQCAATGDPQLCGLIHRDSLGTLWLLTDAYTITTEQNIGKLGSRGLDINATYRRALGDRGSFVANVMGTYLLNQNVDTGLFAYDCVGFYGNQCGVPTPTWRHLSRFSWDTNFNTTLTLAWRMIGSVKNDDLSDNPAIGDPSTVRALELNEADKIPTFNFFDVSANWRVRPNYNVVLGVNNIMDTEPPLGAGASDNDFGPGFYGTYDHLGRYFFAGLQFNIQ